MSAERMFRGDTMSFDVVVNEDGSAIDGAAKLWFVLKHNLVDPDARALAILTSDFGGGVRANSPAAGSARATVLPASTAALPSKLTRLEYAWRMRDASGSVSTLKTGVLFVDATAPISLDAAPFGGSSLTPNMGALAKALGSLTLSGAGLSGAPTFALYADVPSSITASGGIVSAWGTGAASGGVKLENDSVDGNPIVRFDTGAKLTMPSGALDFASQGAVSFAFVFRQRIYASSNDYTWLDTTNGGTTAGVQIVARDNLGLSNGRQLIARVFNGTSWIVDYSARGPAEAYQALLWSVAVVTVTSTSLTVAVDGYTWLSTTFAAITFPSGAASAAVLGDYPSDFRAFEVWQGGLSSTAGLATAKRLQTRFALPYQTVLLWSDPNLGETDPSGCTLADNTYVALSTKNPGPGTNIGVIQARTSPTGLPGSWTPDPGSDGSADGMILPFTAPVGGGMLDSTITQLSNGSVLVVANQTNETRVHTLKAASPAAVRSNTWTSETTVTQGTPTLEICAGDPAEDPANPGHVDLCVYRADGAEAFWSNYLYKSTDTATTWAAPVKFADGVADGINYAEPRSDFVTAAGAATYSDLTTGERIILVRDDANDTMWEFTSTTGLAGSFTRRATNLVAFSAARFRFLQDGTLVALLRDVLYQFNTIYRRIGVVGGVAHYAAAPTAPSVVPAFGGQNNGQYGNICKEVTPGVPLIITATRLDLTRCDTYARFYPERQLFGQMPIVVSPSTVPTKNPGDTVQFSALGAGNYVWSMTANAPSCSLNSSTGLLTIGSAGGIVTVRCTDLNGYFDATQDVSITCNAGASEFTDVSSLLFNFAGPLGVSPSSGLVDSWANQNGAASDATSGATLKPTYGTSTQNALKTLDFTAGAVLNTTLPPGSGTVAFIDHTVTVVFKTGSSIAGTQTLWGNALGGIIIRYDAGVLRAEDYTATPTPAVFPDLMVTPNTAHVVTMRRTGTTVEMWLDGVKSATTCTITNNTILAAQCIGNDLPSFAAETLNGYICQIAGWTIAKSTGNIVTDSASMKSKWGTV